MADFSYKGEPMLTQALSDIDAMQKVDFDFVSRVILNLEAAFNAGLSLKQSEEATLRFFMLLDAVLNDLDTADNLNAAWHREVANRIESFWMPRIPLLEVDDQIGACSVVDRIFASLNYTNPGQDSLRRADKIFRSLPFPASYCAHSLFYKTLSFPRVPPVCIEYARALQAYASDPHHRADVMFYMGHVYFQFAIERTRYSGRELKAFDELMDFNEFLTQHFGTEFAMQKLGFFSSESKKSEAAEERSELYKRLAYASCDSPSSSFTSSFKMYLEARIDAACNEVKRARKTLWKLYDAGFAPVTTTQFLGHILNFLKDDSEILRIVNESASKLLVLRGEQTPFDEVISDAGGNPRLVGLSEYPGWFLAECERTKETVKKEFAPKLAKVRDEWRTDFWDQKEEVFRRYIGRKFTPENFDAMFGVGNSPDISIDPIDLSQFAVDELPALENIDRAVLIEASRHPVKAATVMQQIRKYIDALRSDGENFNSLAVEFPGYGRSTAVCLNELAAPIASKKFKEIRELLDFILKLNGSTEKTLAEMYKNAAPVLALEPPVTAVLDRALGLMSILKTDENRRVVLAASIVQGLQALQNDALEKEWTGICERLMVLSPTEDVSAKLADWLSGVLQKNPRCTGAITAGEYLLKVIGPPHSDKVRIATATAIYTLLLDAEDSHAFDLYSRYKAVYGLEELFQQKILEWYDKRAASSAGSDAVVRLGEKLLGDLPAGIASNHIKSLVISNLTARLLRESMVEAATPTIERLLARSDWETGPAETVAQWYSAVAFDSSTADALAELGERLATNLKGQPRQAVVGACAKVLHAMLADPANKRRQIALLERLSDLCPNDSEVAARLEAAKKARTKFWAIVAVSCAGAIGLLIAGVALFGN